MMIDGDLFHFKVEVVTSDPLPSVTLSYSCRWWCCGASRLEAVELLELG